MCVMYRLWKLTVGVQRKCQVAAGNMKESLRGEGDWSANLTYRINVHIKEQIKIRRIADITKTQSGRNNCLKIYCIYCMTHVCLF